MHPIRGGRFEAMCGKCLQRSVTLPADTEEQTWAELQKIGWTLYKAKTGTREYALCPACTKDPRCPEGPEVFSMGCCAGGSCSLDRPNAVPAVDAAADTGADAATADAGADAETDGGPADAGVE